MKTFGASQVMRARVAPACNCPTERTPGLHVVNALHGVHALPAVIPCPLSRSFIQLEGLASNARGRGSAAGARCARIPLPPACLRCHTFTCPLLAAAAIYLLLVAAITCSHVRCLLLLPFAPPQLCIALLPAFTIASCLPLPGT